jgi:hypothetical protein
LEIVNRQTVMVRENVIETDLGVRWEPNVEHATLAMKEDGDAQLDLNPHFDDPDQSRVVLVWSDAIAARMEPPNDEARSGHRLYEAGFRGIIWIGEVRDSHLIAELERRNRVHDRHDPRQYSDLRHWIVPLKGSTVEVVASTCAVTRRNS